VTAQRLIHPKAIEEERQVANPYYHGIIDPIPCT
jgi:hypothetical protein